MLSKRYKLLPLGVPPEKKKKNTGYMNERLKSAGMFLKQTVQYKIWQHLKIDENHATPLLPMLASLHFYLYSHV